MKITYLNHSGFLLEWPDCYWLFDYYQGTLPRLERRKKLFVFCSHSHGDHFNPAVFALAQVYPQVVFVFSNQVRKACQKLKRRAGGVLIERAQYAQVCAGLSDTGSESGSRGEERKSSVQMEKAAEEDCGLASTQGQPVRVAVPEICFLQSRTDTELDDGCGSAIRIHTLLSTDCGCAFYLEYGKMSVYHSGDLHWWTWPEESEAENRKMAADFRKEIEFLEGKTLDVAFTVLDPRQEGDYALGLNYLREKVKLCRIFPMHFWNDFSIIDRYLKEYPMQGEAKLYRVEYDGQSWEF